MRIKRNIYDNYGRFYSISLYNTVQVHVSISISIYNTVSNKYKSVQYSIQYRYMSGIADDYSES